ncbi:hypothetical protein Vi05172_g5414 [Venturia inaequalis]|nr:hypothetical protein Vi05172_g5414 [Venturia inaequalis]
MSKSTLQSYQSYRCIDHGEVFLSLEPTSTLAFTHSLAASTLTWILHPDITPESHDFFSSFEIPNVGHRSFAVATRASVEIIRLSLAP